METPTRGPQRAILTLGGEYRSNRVFLLRRAKSVPVILARAFFMPISAIDSVTPRQGWPCLRLGLSATAGTARRHAACSRRFELPQETAPECTIDWLQAASVRHTCAASHFDSRGLPNPVPARCRNDTAAIRFVHSVIATAASYAIHFVLAVASTARRTEVSFAAAVEDTDRSSGQQKV